MGIKRPTEFRKSESIVVFSDTKRKKRRTSTWPLQRIRVHKRQITEAKICFSDRQKYKEEFYLSNTYFPKPSRELLIELGLTDCVSKVKKGYRRTL
jgi:hypothetical protein